MRILVVEDYKPLREAVAQALREQNYVVDEAGDSQMALWHLRSQAIDVVVLDLMLPGISGFDILKTIRKTASGPAVIILTAKDTLRDRVVGLDAGADDYLIKPFSLEELLARIRALIRRRYEAPSGRLNAGPLEIDVNARRAFMDGQEIKLSAREYALLEYLAYRQGQIVSRDQIWRHIYDDASTPESNVVDVYVGLLRKKIDPKGRFQLIQTRRGQGYILEVQSP